MPYRTVAPIGGNLGAMTRLNETTFLVQDRARATVWAWDWVADTAGVYATYGAYNASSQALSAPFASGDTELGKVVTPGLVTGTGFSRIHHLHSISLGVVEDQVTTEISSSYNPTKMVALATSGAALHMIADRGNPPGTSYGWVVKEYTHLDLPTPHWFPQFVTVIPNPEPINTDAGSQSRFLSAIGVTGAGHPGGTGKLINFGNTTGAGGPGSEPQLVMNHTDVERIGEPFNVTALSPIQAPGNRYLVGLAPGVAGFPRLVTVANFTPDFTSPIVLSDRQEPGGDLFGLTTPITGVACTDINHPPSFLTDRWFFTIGDGFIYEATADQELSWWELQFIIIWTDIPDPDFFFGT